MLFGYNHNITYKGTVFHIQTEDSGISKPHIITLLYRDGVIICSKKTSYADILKIDDLEAVIEDLMKEQHKDMMRRLKNGEFDEKAFGCITNPGCVKEAEEKHQELLNRPVQQEETVQKQETRMPILEKKYANLDEAVDSFFNRSSGSEQLI